MTNEYHIFSSKQERDQFLSLLRGIGVAEVRCTFSGSGDSGNFDRPEAYNASQELIDINHVSMPWTVRKHSYNYSTKTFETSNTTESMSLSEIVLEMCNYALDREGIDWYNNEGGQGTFKIDFSVSPPNISLEVGVNEIITHDHSYDFTHDEGPECTPATTP